MDDHSEKSHENYCTEFSHSSDELLGFDPNSTYKSRSLFYLLKCFLLKFILHGADKVVKDRRANVIFLGSNNSVFDTKSTARVCEGTELKDQKMEKVWSSKNKRVFTKSGNTNNFHYYSRKNESNVNFLAFLFVLLIKIVGFQFSLFLSFLTFPIWSSYFLFMFLLFPFQTLKKAKGYLTKKVSRVWSFTLTTVTSSVSKRAKAQKSKAVRMGRAIFSSIYVCFMLIGLLALGFLFGGFMMRNLIEKPIQTLESLNFDYNKFSPVAFVPLKGMSVENEKRNTDRFVPRNHKMHVSVSLTVPESEYNHNLGVFQVRVDFLSEKGNVLASSSHPCMLRFKSRPIVYAETFLKTIPIIAGFQSESQIVNVKTTEFTEGIEPTACLRIVLEQRAEFKSGQGIPQIYEASLLLESELPKFKRFVWLWRRTMFVWISIMSFLTTLIIILVFVKRPFFVCPKQVN